jgi:CubicO group peptidase (beta-lactamase class C family)
MRIGIVQPIEPMHHHLYLRPRSTWLPLRPPSLGFLALAFVASGHANLAAQQPDLARAADTIFQAWNSTHTPGCAVGVARGGQVLLARGYGMADLETGTPITPETVFESGSVAKQFTATAVLLLATDGKLDLDQLARRYLPELPEYDRPITIRHLLTHTSGLREWSSLVAWQGWPRGTRAHTQADLLEVVIRQKALNYPVGDYYSYTNSGYALAMTLVERVSGQSFQEFTHQRIFQPLGMTHTRWRDDFTRLVPGRAQAYHLEDDGWHLDMPFESVVGPGGLLTTVGDWLAWNQALAQKTLGAALTDSLTRRMRLTSGREIPYALGLFVTDYRGVPEISHSGSTAGYSTFLARYPDRGQLSIAVMCNSANASPATYAHRLADRLIADFPPAAPLDTTPVDPGAFARYAGVYRNDRTHAPLEVRADEGRRLRALPGEWYWLPNGLRWHFDMGPGGKPAALRVAQADGDTVRYTYVAGQPWRPSTPDLQAFAGSYRSEELGVTYAVALAGDTLTLTLRPGRPLPLRPAYPDAFTVRGSTVWFSRDRSGRIAAMHVGESRVWDLVFAKTR